MHEAGCLDPAIQAWCAGLPPPPPPPPSFFCGSRLITQAAWEHRLLAWCEKTAFMSLLCIIASYENDHFTKTGSGQTHKKSKNDPFSYRMPLELEGKQWSPCFSSFTDDATTPSTFHRQCEQYDTTLLVLRNSLNYTFGGYVRLPLASFRSCYVI
eukprot:COSAG06_NODE_2504_length_6751_cov_103.337041_3_plen_155_part_00